ncbi:MAG: GntR family transcriptional regulator [Leptolyngbyaceae cyanobacterium SL_7_1]|nr:GntR family transcriptional regulator [Leptolyngbyaceae cyanobacterium SL_7_1]
MSKKQTLILPRSLDVQAADVLREQILNGTFAPGTRLLEIELAEQFNLSRGTIRSALQQLTFEGLVVQFPYRGCAVSGLSAQDAWELYTLRGALEGLAARLVAETITPNKIAPLNAALQTLVDAAEQNSWQAVAKADFSLHQAIVQFANHRRLQEQYKIVGQQIQLYIISSNALNPNLDSIVEEHQQLVSAICSGDGAIAEQIARDHSSDGKALVEHLQTLEQQNQESFHD